jgi:cytidine deaminase
MTITELVAVATAARQRAYAPYSEFAVGAALLMKSGKVFAGCNVENVSLGLTICAERSVVAAAIADGHSDFESIAVVTNSNQPALPCGACRQVLAEFNPTMKIIAVTISGGEEQFLLSDLLPFAKQGLSENV